MRFEELPTPCFLVDEGLLVQNLEILQQLMERTGCRILLAQKAFSMFYFYPLIGQYLSGATASGLYEARLGARERGRKTISIVPPTGIRSLMRSSASAIISSLILSPNLTVLGQKPAAQGAASVSA